METYVVRVWLPDRPGALGQVASRIGAVQGDVIGIEILERGGGSVIDELRVTLPHAGLVDLLVGEIREVDGVAVEDVRPVSEDRLDGALGTLATANAIVATDPETRLDVACDELRSLLEADWVAAIDPSGRAVVASSGAPPAAEWTNAFLAGSEHLDPHLAPGDVLAARLSLRGLGLACGRAGRVFHAREREEFRMLASIVDAIDRAAVEARS